MKKCRELNADLVTAAAKVESVAQDSYANDQAMELNNKELEQVSVALLGENLSDRHLHSAVLGLGDDQ